MRIYSKLNRPIIIVDYNPEWIILFEDEKHRLIDALKDNIISVEHIGSTAVPGLSAKPIIDIALGIESFNQSKKHIPIIKKLGYHYVPEFESILPERRFFWKGTDKVHTYHIHMTETTNPLWTDPIIFRDYLKTHPSAKQKYGNLKKRLAILSGNDIEKYIKAKTEFIESILKKYRT